MTPVLLFSLCALFLAEYIGGLGLALVFASIICLFLLFSAYNVFPRELRYIAASLVATSLFVFVFATLIPLARRIRWLRNHITETISGAGTDYVSLANNEIIVVRPWFVMASMSILVLVIWPVIHLLKNQSQTKLPWRSKLRNKAQIAFDEINKSSIHFLALIPLSAIAWLQYQSPVQSLAFTMSGDARNIFLQVMRMRLTGAVPGTVEILKNGMFGEVLGFGMSVTNNVHGFPNIHDQYAIRSVYVLSLSLICVSVGAIIYSFTVVMNKILRYIWSFIAFILSFFVLVNPYPLAEVLRSGFFSMFVSLGFLIATIAIAIVHRTKRMDTAFLLLLGLGTTYVSYQLFAAIVVPVVVFLVLWSAWSFKTSKIWRVCWLIIVAVIAAVVGGQYQDLYDEFTLRVLDGGAIEPTSVVFTVGVLAASSIFLVFRQPLRLLAFKSVIMSLSAVVTLRLVVAARDSAENMYGYYGYKLVYAANYVSWFLVFAIVLAIISMLYLKLLSLGSSTWRRIGLGGVSLFSVVAPLATIFLSLTVPTAESPVKKIFDGWVSPSEAAVSQTLDLWKNNETKYIVAQYSSDINDRLTNFWSPYFWEANRWEWTYSGYRADVEGLCGIIAGNRVLLLTGSETLVRDMRQNCPSDTTKMRVRYLKQSQD